MGALRSMEFFCLWFSYLLHHDSLIVSAYAVSRKACDLGPACLELGVLRGVFIKVGSRGDKYYVLSYIWFPILSFFCRLATWMCWACLEVRFDLNVRGVKSTPRLSVCYNWFWMLGFLYCGFGV